MNHHRELALTRLLLALTAFAVAMAFAEIAAIGAERLRAGSWIGVGTQIFFAVVIAALTYGFFVYFLTRIGYLQRVAAHVPADRASLEALFAEGPTPLAVLVPSFKEETAIVRRTLLSAALQEYPHRRVVLLIDDPCRPASQADAAALEAMRRLPRELQRHFDTAARWFREAERDFVLRQAASAVDSHAEARLLARRYEEAADWFDREIRTFPINDHGDSLFVTGVLTAWRDAHRARAARFGRMADGSGVDRATALREHRRLATLFRVDFASFERKRYENLSHEPNKAMNLNSYLALMGKSFREMRDPGGRGLVLKEVRRGRDTLDVPDAELVLTLDADSILLPGYALRLAHVMSLPGNERVAVVQTPYSAFPGAPGVLERVAGATTDIQYLIHQGFTRYNATFWVGANALLRKAALEDICSEFEERGHRLRKYIQDRTVIEDTESSIDLADRGWTLFNYPERLAYSATPTDFGSLLIQRRRWSNGGLIILPKALRYLARGPLAWRKLAEGLCRVHYLTSVAVANVALLIILFGDFEQGMRIVWLPLCSLPYMFLYARDLVRCGYHWSDFLRVYALNLLLVPVHLGGALKSLHQAATGKRTAFGRTPKVPGRTAAPGIYVVAEYGLLAASAGIALMHYLKGDWFTTAFALAYLGFGSYAILNFIGLRESAIDLRLWLRPHVGSTPEPCQVPPTAEDALPGFARLQARAPVVIAMRHDRVPAQVVRDERRVASAGDGIVYPMERAQSVRKMPKGIGGGNSRD